MVFLPQGPLSAAHSPSPSPPTLPQDQALVLHPTLTAPTTTAARGRQEGTSHAAHSSISRACVRATRGECAFPHTHLSAPTALTLTGATASLARTTACPGSRPNPRPSLPPLSMFPKLLPSPRAIQSPRPHPPHGCPVPARSHSTHTPSPRSCACTPKLHQPTTASPSLISLCHPFQSTLQACRVSVPERMHFAE